MIRVTLITRKRYRWVNITGIIILLEVNIEYSIQNSLLIFRVNLVGRTSSGLLQTHGYRGKSYYQYVLYGKNDVGNVVSVADVLKNIWSSSLMPKKIVGCTEFMGPYCLIS